MALIMDIVRAIRNARAEYDVKPGQAIAATIAAGDSRAYCDRTEILARWPGSTRPG